MGFKENPYFLSEQLAFSSGLEVCEFIRYYNFPCIAHH